MTDTVTVALARDEKDKLDSLKLHPRETYGEVISRLIEKELSRKK